MKPLRIPRSLLTVVLLAIVGLAGCMSSPPPGTAVLQPTPARSVAVAPSGAPQPPMGPISNASTPGDYRLEAAYHLYDQNNARIYKGVMPHFLYAIGVLEVRVDNRGNLTGLQWMRAPDHAPEVMAEIERTVRKAAPFPAPVRMGSASYIETWLWDASGHFQLHTLSEGQGATGTARRALPPNPNTVRVVAAPSAQ